MPSIPLTGKWSLRRWHGELLSWRLGPISVTVPTPICSWKAFFFPHHPLRSEQGVQQGDPLGPLFFSLAWQSVVDALPQELALNIWYLDDGHLIGEPRWLNAAVDTIVNSGAAWGPPLMPKSADCGARWGAFRNLLGHFGTPSPVPLGNHALGSKSLVSQWDSLGHMNLVRDVCGKLCQN